MRLGQLWKRAVLARLRHLRRVTRRELRLRLALQLQEAVRAAWLRSLAEAALAEEFTREVEAAFAVEARREGEADGEEPQQQDG